MAKKSPKTKSKVLKKNNHFSRREFVLYMVVFALVGVFTLWVSLAAPHGGGGGKPKPGSGSGTISLKLPPDVDNNGDGQPNFNDVVSFVVTTSIGNPFVHLQCFQNGVFTAEGWRGYFSGSLDYPDHLGFGLNGGGWSGGAADCKADLGYFSGTHNTWNIVTSTSFHVNP